MCFEESPEHAKRLVISSPVLSHKKLQSILKIPTLNVMKLN